MAPYENQDLQRQLNQLSAKVDHLDKQIDLICEDLNIHRGVKIYSQLIDISNNLKVLNKDLNEGHVGTIKYKLDDVFKLIDLINKKIDIQQP
jgi:hypothetical protein